MKSPLNIWLMLAALTLFASCSKNDDNTAAAISLSVNVSYDAEGQSLHLPLDTVSVTLNNLSNGQSYTAKTNASGIATFSSIVPGVYSGSATLTMTASQYAAATGITVEQDVQYNASFTGSSFQQNNSKVDLTLASGRIGDLVIKQFYYAGSNTSKGASFRDQFVEIYNNSNDTIYLDSLFVGNTTANNTTLAKGGAAYDWSQSLYMPIAIGNPSKDYLYFRYLLMIPGAGKDHPLEPGKSVVLAATAINHAATYTDNAGNIVSVVDPTLTVDLSSADFEAYLVDYNRAEASNPATFTPYRWDLDNPYVPNLTVNYIAGANEWTFDATGREDLILFRIPAGKPTTFPTYYDPTVTSDKITSTMKLYAQVPVSYVVDAMEILTPLPTARIPKRIPTSLDATGTFVTGGQYSSQSLVRKTLKTLASGRRVLQDTNNSENDFFTKTKADPSKSEASFSN